MKLGEIYQKYFGKKMNTKGLFLILLLGVALLALTGLPAKSSGKKDETPKEAFDRAEYTKELEQRLEKALSSVRGAGDVSVMLTLSDSGQSVYAQNEQTEKRSSDNTNSAGSHSSDSSFVLKNDSGGGQSPLIVKNNLPKISGVLVTAQGADNAEVKNDLAAAVRAVLDVPAHRVQVLCKQ